MECIYKIFIEASYGFYRSISYFEEVLSELSFQWLFVIVFVVRILEFLFDEPQLHDHPPQKLSVVLYKRWLRFCQWSVFTRFLLKPHMDFI